VSPFAIDQTSFGKVVTVIDPSIADSTSTFAIHASSSSSTVFISGKDIANHLKSLETDATKLQELAAPGEAAAAPAPAAKAPAKEKEDAKIEGAPQIAIGVKKEVDFAAWYTNVCLSFCVVCIHHSSLF
jgi:prolyl-tRNA synthetase